MVYKLLTESFDLKIRQLYHPDTLGCIISELNGFKFTVFNSPCLAAIQKKRPGRED